MKKTLFKFAAVTFLGACALSFSGVSRAADTNSVSAPGKISGTVTAVDTNAMTFTVGGQTFEETSFSMLSKNGKPATLSEVAVGDAVKGSYSTGSDGKLEATKVKFGKGEAGSAGTKAKSAAKKAKKKKKSSTATATNAVPDSIPAPPVPDATAPLPPVMDTPPSTNATATH